MLLLEKRPEAKHIGKANVINEGLKNLEQFRIVLDLKRNLTVAEPSTIMLRQKSQSLRLLRAALILLCLTSTKSHAHVGGELDVSVLQRGIVTVQNTLTTPIKCRLMARGDMIWFEIDGRRSYTSKTMKTKVKFHELSLFCQKIDKATKTKPWRIDAYQSKPHRLHTVFQL